MSPTPKSPTLISHVVRALIEVGFIIFLFYSNLLMGEYNRANGTGKPLSIALTNIFTTTNFAIALFAATIGYIVFETLRSKL